MSTTLQPSSTANHDLDPGKVVALSVADVSYRLFLPDLETDYIQGKIATGQAPYEVEMLDDMRARLAPGEVVLDIGANVGNHTLYLAAIAGARVIAFEPNTELAAALGQSVVLNGLLEQVAINTIGLGRESAQGDFRERIADNLGAQSLEVGSGEITIRALDDLDLQRPVRVMKIDVEGMELAVLEGGARLIAQDRPLIYVECMGVEDFKRIDHWMERQNYTHWDTFNATPTHLFIPREQTSLDQRLERLQRKEVIGSYQSNQQLQPLRASLTTANQKYREACQRIDVLKAQISQEQQVRAQLEETRLTLGSERARAGLLEKNLADKEQLCASQIAQLTQLEERLGQLRHAYDVVSQEVEALKLQCEEHEAGRQATELVLVATREQNHENVRQLEAMQGSLDSERKVFIEHVTQLNQLLARKVEAAQERDQRIALLEGELAQITEQVALLTQQHRSEQVHSQTLAQQLEHEQAARKTLEALLKATEAQNQEQQAFLTQAMASTSELSSLQHAHEALEAALAQEREASSSELLALQHANEVLQSGLLQAQQALEAVQRQSAADYQQSVQRHGEELAQAREVLAQLSAGSQRLSAELRSETERRQAVEQRLIKTRASVTYQLGYQLKAGVTSLKGFIRLPGSLLGLYRQTAQQRKTKRLVRSDSEALPVDFVAPEVPHEAPVLLSTDNVELSSVAAPASQLKIACIMDEFTFGSYNPEANLLQLTPGNWRAELDNFRPELLFIESAWRGKDELWGSKVGHNASELQGIVRWCNEHSVPTVFWNKEDPVHFETFLSTAKQFDHVFTTDFDCIHRYKAALGHERVYFLPFACQPTVHNPIERYERKDAFCFAGAYYVRYPERTRDLGNFMSTLTRFKPVEIYDRNYGKNDPNYQFPTQYQPFIVGTLKSSEIDRAYKGYQYAINLNSVKQSQTMFARRVYELLGCNTVTVSNFSRGIRQMFGDLVVTTDDAEQMLQRLEQIAVNPDGSDKLRLAGLRKVMLEHTYAQRLSYVIAKAKGRALTHALPEVAVLACARSSAQMHKLIASFERQTLQSRRLHILLSDGVEVGGEYPGVHFLQTEQLAGKTIAHLAGDAQWVAGWVADDFYGPNYLLDLVLATRYSQADAFGKVECFQVQEGEIRLQNPGRAYHKAVSLMLRAALIRAQMVSATAAADWMGNLLGATVEHGRFLAVDRYNYCRAALEVDETLIAARVNDLELDTGSSIELMQQYAEAVVPAKQSELSPEMSIDELIDVFGACRGKDVSFVREEHGWQVSSKLEDGKHEYVYALNDLSVAALGDVSKLYLDVTPGLNIQLVMLFMDANNQRISHVMLPGNRNHAVDIPPETVKVRLGWRIYASGSAQIRALVRGHRDTLPAKIISSAEHLVLTNNYPAYDDLYRNGFVHSRVRGYSAAGVKVDVLRFRDKDLASFGEFQGQDVFTGGAGLLEKMLSGGQYKTVLVHFLSPAMWDVLERFIDRIKVVVWLHGAEIHPWHRRQFNYESDSQRELAKVASEKRMAFWQRVLVPMHPNLHLVMVSRAFAREVMEDTGVTFSAEQHSIIHNPVDVKLFSYVEKPLEQRRKILSIRPFASRQYANDLTVKAILELARLPIFEQLEFRIVGDGVLFDETVEPLRQFANVTLEKRFLNHEQIARLHKEHGIFMCPTRWDSQGVSRDEAMASGLVAVTTAVAAIPEFADQQCAGVVAAEDHVALAQEVVRLVEDEQLFRLKSQRAAERVRSQSASDQTIAQELRLFHPAASNDDA